MPARRHGKCCLCGIEGSLSFEHIPPRAAFNDRPVIRSCFENLLGLGPDEPIRGRTQQRGMGDYTLCSRCNNNTGQWYGSSFVAWCYQGYDILAKSGGNPSLIYLYHLLPLRIIKQIIVMFFSVNGPEFRDAQPRLVKFVLNKEEKYLPPGPRFFVYYNISSTLRTVGVIGTLDINSHEINIFSEINYFPFGYVMTLDSPAPDTRLFEITHFARYGYNEFAVNTLRLPVLPTHLWYPGDYRTKEQIAKDWAKNVGFK